MSKVRVSLPTLDLKSSVLSPRNSDSTSAQLSTTARNEGILKRPPATLPQLPNTERKTRPIPTFNIREPQAEATPRNAKVKTEISDEESNDEEEIQTMTTEKNEKILSIVKKQKKKLRFTKKDYPDAFDEKMKKGFGNLKTFLDIRDTIQDLNTDNRKVVIQPIHPKTMKKIQVIHEESPPKKPTIENFQKFKGKVHSLVAKQKFFHMMGAPFAVKNSQKLFFDEQVEEDPYEVMINQTDRELKQTNHIEAPEEEITDIDYFYNTLQDDIVNRRFLNTEMDDHNDYQLKDKFAALRIQEALEFDPLPIPEDKYKKYKSRAENVIKVLKKTTKNIFNKGGHMRPKLEMGEKSESESTLKKSEAKSSIDQVAKTFLTTSQTSILQLNKGARKDLDSEYKSMQKKIRTLGKKPFPKELEGDKLFHAQVDRTKEINKAYKLFAKHIIDETIYEKHDFLEDTDQIKRSLKAFEENFDKDMKDIMPMEMFSLRLFSKLEKPRYTKLAQPRKKGLPKE